MERKGLLERLRQGVVIGDGGFVIALEKRGYVSSGLWTPEVSLEHPEAVRQLHREFLRAGSDVMQAFTYNSSEDKLAVRGDQQHSCRNINLASCRLAREVANEGDALVAGGLSWTQSYQLGKGKAAVQAEVRKQLDIFSESNVDFILLEFFFAVEEMEWALEEAKKMGKTLAATMVLNEEGDVNGVPPGQCAIRLARAGADVVGLNCMFDIPVTLKTIKLMKEALAAEGLEPFLMTQANGFHSPDAPRTGYIGCPEYPYAMEARQVNRMDVQKYARAAYELGVRYIGGCCGFEAYHIRAIAEELAEERGKLPAASEKHKPLTSVLMNSNFPFIRARASREYWEKLVPSSGRLLPPATVDQTFSLHAGFKQSA